MPSLLEILNDPNYVNANSATKEAIFNKYAQQDTSYTGANDATKEAIRQRFGVGAPAQKKVEELPEGKSAGFSLGDIGRAFASGAVGAGKSLTDVFGADNVASEGLGDVQKYIQAGYTPERAAEMARRQRLEQEASASGSVIKEIGAFLGGVAEAPLQSLAQGLGSIVPYVGTGVVGAVAKLSRPTLLALNTVVGTAQGAGTIKGTVYDNVKDELIKSGMDEQQAEQQAKEAQSYLGKNFLDIAAGAGLGAVGARFGVESLVGKKLAGETAEEVAKKGLGRRVGEAALAEAPMEALQAGQEQLAANLALQREGFERDALQGVFGAAARDAVIGGLTAGTVGALPSRQAPAITKSREDFKEQVRADLDARGETYTEEQLDTIVDKAMNVVKGEKEKQDEGSGLNTGAGESGVSVSGQQGTPGATTGTTDAAQGDLGGTSSTTDAAENRATNEQDTLDKAKQEDAVAAEAAPEPDYLVAARSLLEAVDRGGLALNTRKVNDIARAFGMEVKKGAKPLDTIARIREAVAREDQQKAAGVDTTAKAAVADEEITQTITAPTVERREQAPRGRSGTYYEYVAKDATGKEIGVFPTKKAAQEAVDLATLSQEEFFAKYPNLKAPETTPTPPPVAEVKEEKPKAAPPIAEEIDTNLLAQYHNGLLDAMMRTPASGATTPEAVATLKANGLITDDGNGRLAMTPKGAELLNDIRNAVQFGSSDMTAEEQKALFAKYIPELGGAKIQEGPIAKRKKKPTQLNARSLPKVFMDWFRGSKVVDENGNPLVVYHGTTKDFKQFKLSKEGSLGVGIYTTPISAFANNYAGMPTPAELADIEAKGLMSAEQIAQLKAIQTTGELVEGQVGGNVMPVYVSIQNPLVINTVNRGTDPAVDLLVALGVSQEKAEAIVEKAYEDKGGITKEVMARAQKQGYDGIMQYKDGALSEVVAFSPNQIKFALQVQNTSPRKDSLDAGDPIFGTAHPRVVAGIRNNDIKATLEGIRDTAGKFLSGVASRLLQLNLTTRLSFDEHYELVVQEAEKVQGQRDRILEWIRAVYPQVYEQYFNVDKMESPYVDMAEAFNALEQGAITTADGKPLRLESIKEDIADVAKVYRDGMRSLAAPATFFINQNTATFRSEDGTSNYTVMHEIAHAATHWAINNPDQLDAKQAKALSDLTDLFDYAKKNAINPDAYGYTNLHEFVAEAFSNPAFQMELRAMKKVMDTDMSAWSKFIQLVSRLFGVDNVLFHTLANADVLFSANVDSTVSGAPSQLWAPDRLNVFKGNFILNTAERTGSKIWGTFNNLIKGRVKWSDLDKKNLGKFLASTNEQYRKYLLGALTLDQLTDIAGKDMPQFELYVKEIDAMLNTRNQILAEGDIAIKDWSNLLEKNPQKAEALSKMMTYATINKIDPDSQGIGHDATKFNADPDLKAEWTKLISGPDGDTALSIYRSVRNFYERRMDEYIDIQLKRTAENERAKGTPQDEIDKKIIAKKAEINKQVIRPYFPIKRFGDYWLQIGKGPSKIFMQFEDAYARDAKLEEFRQRLIEEELGKLTNPTDEQRAAAVKAAEDKIDAGNGFSQSLNEKISDIAHLKRIEELINETTADIVSSMDPKVTADPVAALRDKMVDEFKQYYIELLPEQSIQKMFLHRDNISGSSADMLRAFSVSRQRVAYQRARFQHMPQLFNIIDAANLRLKTAGLSPEEKLRLRDYVREFELNLRTAVLEPPKQSRLTTFATNFGFLQFLSAPASAVVNMMAIPGIYTPFAAARYDGVSNVTTTISRYARMLGGTGLVSDSTGRYEFLSLSRANLGTKNTVGTDADSVALPQGFSLQDVYDTGVARGIIDVTQSHEAANLGETPSNEYTGRWNKFMYYASLPFHSAEKFNREMSYMATFDMAYRKNIKKGMAPEAAYEKALQEARDVTQKTMFNYTATNKPRYFRGDLRNIVLQFKLYPQHMSVLMFRTFQQAFTETEKAEMERIVRDNPTATPDQIKDMQDKARAELRETKKEAQKAFIGMMGMAFVTAGFTGMPLFFVFSGVASAFHAVFGDDDEPFDAENWFKNWTNRTFGGFLGDAISRGIMSQATGLNFADRMNMNLTDMWFPDVRKSADEVTYLQNMMIALLGPTAGAGINFAEGIKRMNDGHIERGLEVMMPAAIKNVMVGTRYMTEGQALTLRGAQLDDDIPAASALAQMLGFSPEDTAQKQRAAFETKNVNEKIVNRRTDLQNAFFIAVDTGDADMLERVIEKIGKFNNTNPGAAIMPDTLIKSVTKRYKDRALANVTGGMSLNKNLIPQLEGMLDYSRD